MRTTKSFRRRKRLHLTPLVNLPVYLAMHEMESMSKRTLRALLAVMDELTEGNCRWAEYHFAQAFRPALEQRLATLNAKRRTN